MPKIINHRCVGCNLDKNFRADQKFCSKDCRYKKSGAEVAFKENVIETNEIKGDSWNISLNSTRIHTLEQLVEHSEIDLSIWEVERFIVSKHELGMKPPATTEYITTEDNRQIPAWVRFEKDPVIVPLFSVKAWLKKKKDVVAAKNEIEDLKTLAKDYAPEPPFIIREQANSGLMLEINMSDIHVGKLGWEPETGYPNYDVKIAEKMYWTALETLLSRVANYNFDQVVLIVGNDLINSDDIEGRTTAGTYVSSDARYHKTFATVRTMMVKTIERLRQVAPTKAIIVNGNHDQLSCFHLGDSLECFFHKYQDVEIDNLPRSRKYHQFGKVMLLLTHGHKGKREDYPLTMATEQPRMFADTKYREAHTGHNHKNKVDEYHGVRVRILSALSGIDDWTSENNFTGNLRSSEAFVWSAEEGLIGTAIYTVQEEQ